MKKWERIQLMLAIGIWLLFPDSAAAEKLRVKVLAAYPHDAGAYTQGLQMEGDVLLESTGLEGQSSLRRVDPKTGKVLQKIALAPHLFGEGLARLDTRLVQLTWRNEIAIVYDAATLTELERWRYSGEGWGLAYDGNQLIHSDGSAWLTFRDPNDFSLQGRVEVKLDGVPIDQLNELEFAEGKVYANLYGADEILKIDPTTGKVEAVIDARGLLKPNEQIGADVLNGIAWDAKTKTFWITGKRWPKMFQVVFEK